MVCKKWSKTVLDYLRDHPSQRPASNRSNMESLVIPLDEVGIFPIRLETALDFKKHMKKLSRSINPLPGNSVAVYLGSDEIFEYIFQGNQWFELFGQHVMYLFFHIEMTSNNVLNVYQTMRDWINLCPNLRSFLLRGKFQSTDDNEERTLKTLGIQVRVFGIEFGTSLESFKYDFQDLPLEFSNVLIGAVENSVQKLWFPLDQWNSTIQRVFTSVIDLEIDNVISIVMLHDFVRACFPNKTQLQRLRLGLRVAVDWTDLLIILEIISVKSLEIDYDVTKTPTLPLLTNLFNTRLCIACLEQLSIFDTLGLTFDFLVNFPSLKHLHVKPFKFDAKNSFQMQDLEEQSGLTKLDKTIRGAVYNGVKPDFHLWLTLPSLKILSVGNMLEGYKGNVTYPRDVFIKRRIRVVIRQS